jgi:hypothetical protein
MHLPLEVRAFLRQAKAWQETDPVAELDPDGTTVEVAVAAAAVVVADDWLWEPFDSYAYLPAVASCEVGFVQMVGLEDLSVADQDKKNHHVAIPTTVHGLEQVAAVLL